MYTNVQYLSVSQCILAIRRPGKVNSAPKKALHKAKKNFNTSFDAGPLKSAWYFLLHVAQTAVFSKTIWNSYQLPHLFTELMTQAALQEIINPSRQHLNPQHLYTVAVSKQQWTSLPGKDVLWIPVWVENEQMECP
jgi:hypothetical protein